MNSNDSVSSDDIPLSKLKVFEVKTKKKGKKKTATKKCNKSKQKRLQTLKKKVKIMTTAEECNKSKQQKLQMLKKNMKKLKKMCEDLNMLVTEDKEKEIESPIKEFTELQSTADKIIASQKPKRRRKEIPNLKIKAEEKDELIKSIMNREKETNENVRFKNPKEDYPCPGAVKEVNYFHKVPEENPKPTKLKKIRVAMNLTRTVVIPVEDQVVILKLPPDYPTSKLKMLRGLSHDFSSVLTKALRKMKTNPGGTLLKSYIINIEPVTSDNEDRRKVFKLLVDQSGVSDEEDQLSSDMSHISKTNAVFKEECLQTTDEPSEEAKLASELKEFIQLPTSIEQRKENPGTSSDLVKDEPNAFDELKTVFNCSYCSKTFNRLWVLKSHMRLHNGEKPFTCNFQSCNRTFADRSNLRAHQRTRSHHSWVWRCATCTKAFSQEKHLDRHRPDACAKYVEFIIRNKAKSVIKPEIPVIPVEEN